MEKPSVDWGDIQGDDGIYNHLHRLQRGQLHVVLTAPMGGVDCKLQELQILVESKVK